MKKIVIVLMLALLLVGCGKHDASLSNGEDVIWSEKNHDYKAKDLYNDLKSQDYTGIVIRSIVNKIAELEGIDASAIKEKVDKDVDAMLEAYGQYIFQYYGTTEDEYRKSYYSESLLNELLKKTINESFETYVNDYTPYKAEIAYFDSLDTTKAIIEDVKSGEHTFAYAALENGYASEITEQVYTDVSELPVEVKDYVLNTSNTELSDVIQSSTYTTDADGNSTITPRYYLVNITTRNVNEFKDEFIDWLVANDMNSEEVLITYMTKHNVKIYDQKTFELINEKYGDFH